MNDLLLVQFFRYEIKPERFCCNDDSYAKETMFNIHRETIFNIHSELFKKDPYYDEGYYESNTYGRYNSIKQYCLNCLQNLVLLENFQYTYRAVREFNKY